MTSSTPAPLEGAFALLDPRLQRAVTDKGYTTPSPIQEQAIPPILEGKDLLGAAQTGTGKTAAFSLPMLQILSANSQGRAKSRHPRALLIAPTRELAAQIADSLKDYGRHLKLTHTVIFGGVGYQPQVKALRSGVDIVVATPGRLLDLMNEGHMNLSEVEFFVLDEVDRMLDMGFLPDIKRVLKALPPKRHSLFFSATMPPAATNLAASLLDNPTRVTIAPNQPAVERIEQEIRFIEQDNKVTHLVELLAETGWHKTIVFTQMKHMANRVVERLEKAGVRAAAIHGNKSQGARTRALKDFTNDIVHVLVATDIASRGIDVDGVSHVVNFDLPVEAETYVHRIGRTARAGAEGSAVSFCSPREREYLRQIERLLKSQIPVVTDHPFHSQAARDARGDDSKPLPKGKRGGGGGQKRDRSRRPKGSVPGQKPRGGSFGGGSGGGGNKRRAAAKRAPRGRG